ncbi:MAG TPA: hypothetical protein VE987_17750, partial [Polyangiaceae bacterium]|nr:hypothetical protein [Polyangiaceae bacterium]
FKIDDLALFFALAIARDPNDPHDPLLDDPSRDATTRSKASFIEQMTDSTLRTVVNNVPFTSADDFLQGSLATDIPGFTEFPTPQAAARSLFLDYAHQSSFMQNTIDMNGVLCADGDPFIQVHNDSIFAWEAPDPSGDTFYDAVRPLLRAFVKHDECLQRDPSSGWCMQSQNAVKIFLDLMSLLHEHWASQQSTNMGYPFQASDRTMPRFSTGDGLVTYEPLLGDVMLNSDLVPSMIHLAPTLQAATLDGDGASPPALPALLATAQWALDPGLDHAGLAYRSGATTTVESDGTTQVARITPYYLIADAYAAKRAQLAAAPVDRQGAWRAATATLVDEMLTMERVSGSWRAKNRKLHGVTVALVDFLLGRYDAHAAAGDLDAWVHGNLIGDLGDAIGGPTFAALADLTAKLEASPDALGKLYAMLQPLVDPANEPTFTTTLTGAGDLLQVLLDDADLVPIAHTLASVVDPASGAATAQLKLLKKARALDPNRPMPGDTTHVATLVQVIRNLFQEPAGHGATPIAQLADAIAEVNRCLAHDDQLCGGIASAPAAGSDLIGDDYRHVLGEIRSFLVDEQRGFQRFIEIVKSRNVGAPPM